MVDCKAAGQIHLDDRHVAAGYVCFLDEMCADCDLHVMGVGYFGDRRRDHKAGPGRRDVEVKLIPNLDQGQAVPCSSDFDLTRFLGQNPLLHGRWVVGGDLDPPHVVQVGVLDAHVSVPVLNAEPDAELCEGSERHIGVGGGGEAANGVLLGYDPVGHGHRVSDPPTLR